MRFFAVPLIFFGVAASHAQTPVVPHKMRFANMTLTIRDDARREIQHDVDAFMRHPKYFDVKVERAKTYFPIIDKIFEEEEVPEDLKYLVLQESSLVPDAVSTSNAVGFWQFKDFTAISMGLRVDGHIDERMNIASASRGAAKYLKKNNEQFDNWILALQAYQMGAGGVKRAVGEEHNGKGHFEVTSETYWYIKKFLAHKVAFENAVQGEPVNKAIFMESKKKRSLADLAKEVDMTESELLAFNKWVLKGVIPDDKPYVVVIPNGKVVSDFHVLTLASKKASKAEPLPARPTQLAQEIKLINGLKAIKALENESLVTVTNRAGVSVTHFLKWNEMAIDQPIEPGTFYFLEKKKKTGAVTQHQVKLGDDLWLISQKYGVQLKRLKKWNQIEKDERLAVGTTIWLDAKHFVDASDPLPEVSSEQVVALGNDTFNWTIAPVGSIVTAPALTAETLVKPLSDTILTEVPKDESHREHIIVKGETLYSVAKIYNVSVMQLVDWNKLSLQEGLKIGQKVVLYPSNEAEKVHASSVEPSPRPREDQVTHQVRESDTLYAIARQYGVTIKDLMDWNDKKELTVKEGEKIIILKK